MDQPGNESLIDRTAVDNIRAPRKNGAPDPLRKILTTYLDTTVGLLKSLREAAKAGDCDAVQRSAHSLKSSSAAVGALSLSEICRGLELQAADNRADGLETLAIQALEKIAPGGTSAEVPENVMGRERFRAVIRIMSADSQNQPAKVEKRYCRRPAVNTACNAINRHNNLASPLDRSPHRP